MKLRRELLVVVALESPPLKLTVYCEAPSNCPNGAALDGIPRNCPDFDEAIAEAQGAGLPETGK